MDRRMIEKAFISGQIARSIFKEEEKLFLIKADDTETILDCTPYDESLFFNSGAEIKTFEHIPFEDLRKELIKEKSFFDALYATIGGFDPELPEETRILSIQRAENLTKEPDIFDFLKTRLFSNLTPGGALLEEALELAEKNGCRNMKFIYDKLHNGREVIAYVLASFKNTISELSLEKEYVKIKNVFINAGFFSQIFLHLTDKNLKCLNRLFYEFAIDPKIREEIPLISQILTGMKNQLKKKYKLKIKQSNISDELTKMIEWFPRTITDHFHIFKFREVSPIFKCLFLSIALPLMLPFLLYLLIYSFAPKQKDYKKS